MTAPEYDSRKAAQIIARFANLAAGGRLHVVKAMKLLYVADRRSVAATGFPMLDEDRVSMPHGPVNSTTYRYVSGEKDVAGDPWSDYVRDRADHRLSATRRFEPRELDELSEVELAIIDGVWADLGHMDEWTLRDWSHDPRNIPEWEDPNGGSLPIPLRRIMQETGMDAPADQAEAADEARAAASVLADLAARHGG